MPDTPVGVAAGLLLIFGLPLAVVLAAGLCRAAARPAPPLWHPCTCTGCAGHRHACVATTYGDLCSTCAIYRNPNSAWTNAPYDYEAEEAAAQLRAELDGWNRSAS